MDGDLPRQVRSSAVKVVEDTNWIVPEEQGREREGGGGGAERERGGGQRERGRGREGRGR